MRRRPRSRPPRRHTTRSGSLPHRFRLLRGVLAFAALAGGGALFACGDRGDDASAEGRAPAPGHDEILSELRGYYRDFSALDSAAFADRFWPGADITTAWQPPGEPAVRVVVTPVPAFIAQWPAGPGSKPIFEEWMIDAQVRTRGNLAQAWVRYGARFGDSAAVEEWQGIDAFTLMRSDGRWRIVELAFGADAGPEG